MRTSRIAVVALAIGAAVLAVRASALALGDAMPAANVALTGVDGREVSLAQEAGKKGTLVIFSCNHCPWVKAWQDRLVALGNAYGNRGIGVVLVNSNDPEEYPADDLPKMRELAREEGYSFPYVMDTTSAVARAFAATHTPEAFLFDATAKLVYHGAIDDNARDAGAVKHAYLRDALDAVVAGAKPEIQETKALGCSIVLRGK